MVRLEHDLKCLERAEPDQQGDRQTQPQQPQRQVRRMDTVAAAPDGDEPREPDRARDRQQPGDDDERCCDVIVAARVELLPGMRAEREQVAKLMDREHCRREQQRYAPRARTRPPDAHRALKPVSSQPPRQRCHAPP